MILQAGEHKLLRFKEDKKTQKIMSGVDNLHSRWKSVSNPARKSRENNIRDPSLFFLPFGTFSCALCNSFNEPSDVTTECSVRLDI